MRTKVICADVSCVYNGGKNICQAESVRLSWNSVMTVWEGRKEFNTCQTREVSTEYLELEEKSREIMKEYEHIHRH